MLDVRPSAWVPPGVRVKFSEKKEGTFGSLVAGSTGRKRIRWSRFWGGILGASSTFVQVVG